MTLPNPSSAEAILGEFRKHGNHVDRWNKLTAQAMEYAYDKAFEVTGMDYVPFSSKVTRDMTPDEGEVPFERAVLLAYKFKELQEHDLRVDGALRRGGTREPDSWVEGRPAPTNTWAMEALTLNVKAAAFEPRPLTKEFGKYGIFEGCDHSVQIPFAHPIHKEALAVATVPIYAVKDEAVQSARNKLVTEMQKRTDLPRPDPSATLKKNSIFGDITPEQILAEFKTHGADIGKWDKRVVGKVDSITQFMGGQIGDTPNVSRKFSAQMTPNDDGMPFERALYVAVKALESERTSAEDWGPAGNPRAREAAATTIFENASKPQVMEVEFALPNGMFNGMQKAVKRDVFENGVWRGTTDIPLYKPAGQEVQVNSNLNSGRYDSAPLPTPQRTAPRDKASNRIL